MRLGIGEGDKVRLGNDRGEVVLHARLFGGMQPGVLVSESIWPSECVRRRHRHQRADQRRSGASVWRRGVPRHRGVDAAIRTRGMELYGMTEAERRTVKVNAMHLTEVQNLAKQRRSTSLSFRSSHTIRSGRRR
jgi:anaerobic selenocysteine-containing dehydrogenase